MATGIFRLRSDDPHMTNSTIVDLHDDAYTTLTTVEVRSGAVVLHCFTSVETAELETEEEEESEEEESEDESEEKEDSDDEDEDEDEDDHKQAKTYTIASGNSVTVRATIVRLEPVGMETAEGVYRVQMMKPAD
jgi:ABC-type Zn2+ transport system substrate-binding protein/surface adhesin